MNKKEYKKISINLTPKRKFDKYDLLVKQIYGYDYARVKNGIYGLT